MQTVQIKPASYPLLIVAGAKGAVGSTLAAAIAALKMETDTVSPWMTTAHKFPHLGPLSAIEFAGWDVSSRSLSLSLEHHRVLPPEMYLPHEEYLRRIPVREAPAPKLSLPE